jgi:hypothetical protein
MAAPPPVRGAPSGGGDAAWRLAASRSQDLTQECALGPGLDYSLSPRAQMATASR